jgi:hypothetical protein
MKRLKKIEIAILIVMFLLSFLYPNFLMKFHFMNIFADLLKLVL